MCPRPADRQIRHASGVRAQASKEAVERVQPGGSSRPQEWRGTFFWEVLRGATPVVRIPMESALRGVWRAQRRSGQAKSRRTALQCVIYRLLGNLKLRYRSVAH